MNEQKMNYEHVLSPIKIGPMTLKNRVSFTPVWPSFATADGHVNRELIEWVRDIVKGGAACMWLRQSKSPSICHSSAANERRKCRK